MESGTSPESIQIPSTPPSGRLQLHESEIAGGHKSSISSSSSSTASRMPVSMTPPPSTQHARFQSPIPRLSAPPVDLSMSPTTTRLNASRNLPSSEKIAGADLEELRIMVHDLIDAVTSARMSAAHFKLQHNLLALESERAVQRAEVECQMSKREVEVLQAAEQRHRSKASIIPRPFSQSQQAQIDALAQTCRELEEERDEAEEHLEEARRVIELERDRVEVLVEETVLLKKRIRENREHFTRLRDQSPLYGTPRDAFTTPRRKSLTRYADETPTHAPFAALIAADQILSQETASVPSTPNKSHTGRFKHGHTRGAHSLSSLNTLPIKARPTTSEGYTIAPDPLPRREARPVYEAVGSEARDRDSTISVSDADDKLDDIVPSQASSLATDMLRKHPASQESLRLSQDAERSSNLLQAKLFGNVKKSTAAPLPKGKRTHSGSQYVGTPKKKRANEGIGLGIEA